MGAIFVSYRRSDSQGEAGRIFDDLVAEFGEDMVFMDVAGIEAGRDFRKVIEESVAQCSVLLVVVGPEWLNAKNESGIRRLDDPVDFVRIETASALRRDIPVIPVLVRGAEMPHQKQLPDDLKDLAYRNCCELSHSRWRSDIQLLIDALRRLVGDAGRKAARSATKQGPSSSRVRIAQRQGTDAAKLDQVASAQIDPAAVQRISRELAVHIGPIADVVVRRLASHCASSEDLCLKAAEEIESPEGREEFLLKQGQILSSAIPVVEESKTQPNHIPAELDLAPLSSTQDTELETASTANRMQRLNRWKSVSLVTGGAILLLLVLALVAHFVTAKGTGSFQVAQSSDQGSPVQELVPVKSDPSPSVANNNAVDGGSRELPGGSMEGQVASNNAQTKPAALKLAGTQPFRVPPEVSATLVIRRVMPNYPGPAQEARVQGAVVLEAAISKEGTIKTLRALSGHPLLTPAAIDAVKQWQYKPLVLNGRAVEMQTLITVNFTLKNP